MTDLAPQFPAALSQRARRASTHMLRILDDQLGDDLIGALIGGSYAAGTAHDDSDLDLFVMVKSTWFQRRRHRLDDVRIDVFIDGHARLRATIEHSGNPAIVRNYATGAVVFDRLNLLADLQRKAKAVLANPPAPIGAGQAFALINHARDLVAALTSLDAGETAAASFLVAKAIDVAVTAHYGLQRRWTVGERETLDDLRRSAPEVARLLERALLGRTVRAAAKSVEDLFEAIFGDVLYDDDDVGPIVRPPMA